MRHTVVAAMLAGVLGYLGSPSPVRAQQPVTSEQVKRFSASDIAPVASDFANAPLLRKEVSVDFRNASLRAVLREVSRQVGWKLLYEETLTQLPQRFTLRRDGVPAGTLLRDVLAGTDIGMFVSEVGGFVALKRLTGWGKTVAVGTLTGRVTERGMNTPIASAQVTVTGMGLTRYTDDKGQYRIPNVPAGEHEVTVRRVGFEAVSRKVRIGDGETVTADFVMGRVATTLTEVVTTATGERSRLEVGNSIGTIKADSVVQTTLIRNFSDLLTARTPGVIVQNSTGAVGAPSKIRIRGINSLTLNNDPIIIVDGVRLMSTATFATSQVTVASPSMLTAGNFGRSSPAPSRLDDIDPNTIESIDVLRGPSAASLYGTEAANGVIVIKTKRGVAGSWRFNILADQGTSQVTGRMTEYWMGWGHQANGAMISVCGLSGWASPQSVAEGNCVQDSLTHFNAFNDPDLTTLGTGSARNLSTTLSGGTEQLKEFLSVRVSDQVGLAKMAAVEERRITRMWGELPPVWIRRPNTEQDISGSSRTTLHIATDLDFSFSANGVYRNILNGDAGLGTGANAVQGPWDTLSFLSAESQRTRQTSVAKRLFASAQATYVPTAWLTFHGTAGGDYTLRSDDALLRALDCTMLITPAGCPSAHANNREEPFITTLDIGAQVSVPVRVWLTSRTSVGEQVSHTRFYGLLAGNTSSTNLAFGTDLLTPSPVATSGTPQLYTVTETRDESVGAGFYVEQMLAFRERLFVTAAFREDAASAFGPSVNKQLPVYPKFSLSWLASDEGFFPWKSVITSFRLRAAYGHSGNQGSQKDVLGNFSQVTTLVDGATTSGVTLTQVGNPALKPERGKELEGGFDLSLFADERIHLEATLYRKISQDAIQTLTLPTSYGTANAAGTGSNLTEKVNIGAVENRGVEVSATAKLIETRRIGWELTVNYTQNGNKLVRVDHSIGSPFSGTVLGYPLFGIWGPVIASYTDLNGDGILEANEVVWSTGPTIVSDFAAFCGGCTFLGAPYPKSELTYDNAVTLWSGAIRFGAKLDQVNGKMENYGVNFGTNRPRCFVDPSCTLDQQATMIQFGTLGNVREIGSSLRLSELSLTYTIPRAMAHRILYAESASVTFAGRNLALWSNYGRTDPDANSTQATSSLTEAESDGQNIYPQPMNWTIRFNLGF